MSLVGTGLGIIKSTGVVGKIGDLFGRGSEPNAGSSNFVDALDNYEKIPTSKARSIESEFTNLIASGASDDRLAEYLARAGGEPGKGQAYKNSFKWKFVQSWIDQTRSMVNNPRTTYGGNGQSVPSAPATGGNLTTQNPMVWLFGLALLIAGFFAFNQ